MAKYARLVLLVAVGMLPAWAGDHPGHKRMPEGWTVPLERLGINGSLERLPDPHTWQVKQVSSYDRSGGNRDDEFGHQVYDGGVVLADLKGPGVVTRIWTRNPEGTLYIYVDDMEHPTLTLPFRDLFTGGLEYWSPGFNLFGPPFVGEGTGGYYSYVPIPYEERCRMIVATTEKALAYQVTYAEFPAGTPIQSFQLSLSPDDVSFFRRWAKNWKGVDFRWPNKKESVQHSRHDYWPGKNTMVFPVVGPGVLTEIELITESHDTDILDKTWIAIHFDAQEEPGVLAPIGDFFGASTKDASDHSSLVIGKHGTRMWCRYPMPFRERAEIRFITSSAEIADIEYYITWRNEAVDDKRYFFARYNSGISEEGRPYRVADIQGEGHYVGTTVAAAGADTLTFLEGDDVYIIDGASPENFHGTGTDDYFNAGWYFASGTFSAPTHATTVKVSTAPAAFAAFRSHITEPVPFRNSFAFELEHGPNNDRPGVAYSSVAYWYQRESRPKVWAIAELEGVDVSRP